MDKKLTKKSVTQLSYDIVGYAIKVHKKLGPGLLESIYEECLKYELKKNGHKVIQQLEIFIEYDEIKLDSKLRLDLLVDDAVIVELKSTQDLHPIFDAKVLSYMSLLKIPQGLLINFNSTNISKSTKPFVNRYFEMLDDE